MNDKITYSKWDMTDEQIVELGAITPDIARDLLVVCFANAQKEMLAKNPELVSVKPTNADINEMVIALLNHHAREIGGSFDAPNKKMLEGLVKELALVSASWGTPQDIVQHHLTLMKKIIARIAD